MTSKKIFVTGATGFIGQRLVKRLVTQGHDVSCLVRKTSQTDELEKFGVRMVVGDIGNDPNELADVIGNSHTVYHLAASTKTLTVKQMMRNNVTGVANLLNACRVGQAHPVVVLVSSLAAVGPSEAGRPRVESDPCRPVSNYGRSKFQAETIARQFSSDLPITIVRPPIVLGPGDLEGLALFKSIDQIGVHLVVGYDADYVSVIHVDDLVNALILAAENGRRISVEDLAAGVYFASASETVSYEALGKMVATALGKNSVRILRIPKFLVRLIGATNTASSYLRGTPQFLNLDKAREATAGSWTCCNQKICTELDFNVAAPLSQRLQQTADWYRDHGWLKFSGTGAIKKSKLAQQPNSTASNHNMVGH